MFDELRYQFQLWRLQREKRSLRAASDKENKALEARWKRDDPGPEKRLEEVRNLAEVEMHEVLAVDEQIARLQTRYLLEQAERYLLPRPPFRADGEGAAWE